jgi:hypothetical protein
MSAPDAMPIRDAEEPISNERGTRMEIILEYCAL